MRSERTDLNITSTLEMLEAGDMIAATEINERDTAVRRADAVRKALDGVVAPRVYLVERLVTNGAGKDDIERTGRFGGRRRGACVRCGRRHLMRSYVTKNGVAEGRWRRGDGRVEVEAAQLDKEAALGRQDHVIASRRR